jgi:Fe-S-cluster containining protein
MSGKKRVGHCKQCGNCCRDFIIDMHVGSVTDFEFTEYLRWLGSHVGIEANIKNFVDRDVELMIRNPCKHLVQTSNGKYICAINDTKPDICKRFPEEDYGDDIAKNCGFKFV